jgi:hypothetical protein
MNLKEESSEDEPMETDDREPSVEDSVRGRARTKAKDSDDEDTRSIKSSRSVREPKKPRRTPSRPPASKSRATSQGPPPTRKSRAKKAVIDGQGDAPQALGTESGKEAGKTEAEKPKKKRRVGA